MLSLAVASRSYSPVGVCGPLIAVASSCGAQVLGVLVSVAVGHGLSCSAVCGFCPDQGLNPYPLHW